MAGKVIDRDLGWGRIKMQLKAKKPYVKVGVMSGTKREDGSPMVQVAMAHEFGTPDGHPPQRSWLRSAHDLHRNQLAMLLRAEYSQIILGRSTFDRSLGLIGLWFTEQVKAGIRRGIAPRLSEATIRRRKAPDPSHTGPRVITPLIDTAQFIENIRHVVVMPGVKT
jgi:hypothetical protein